jgi:UDP-glucose 4-epimerase
VVSNAEPASTGGLVDLSLLARARPELEGRTVAVTGGASFIGSHLVEALVEVGAEVRVIDDLSTGDIGNLERVRSKIEFRHADLADRDVARDSMVNQEIVYHLAAVHGGRGFLSTHPVECLGNVVIDNLTMEAASAAGVRDFVYTSSASVYPVDLSLERWPDGLPEDAASLLGLPGQNPDGPYGCSKLMGEYQLSVFAEHRRMNGVVCRVFNTYGERSGSGHAVRSLIAKALAHLDPFPVWGDGSQTRGFTYVGDVITGLLLCAGLRDFTIVNLGSPNETAVMDVVEEIFRLIGWSPEELAYEIDKPQGTTGRVASTRRCLETLEWQPSTPLTKGLRRTIEWCREHAPESV